MRCVLACSRCRQQKIRCIHDGKPPCTYCLHKGCGDECVLTYPPLKTNKSKVNKRKANKPLGNNRNGDMSGVAVAAAETPVSAAVAPPPPPPPTVTTNNLIPNGELPHNQQGYSQERRPDAVLTNRNLNVVPPPPMDAIFSPGVIPTINNEMLQYQSLKNNVRAPLFSSIQSLVSSTPKSHILTAIKRVEISFPECLFFHIPTYENRLEEVNHILIGALLAVCSYSSPFKVPDLKSEFSSEDKWLGVNSFQVKHSLYEKLALDAIFNNCHFISKPDIEICQSLLLLSCVKWGHNDYFAAWMLHGCAVRMIQAIQFDERFQHSCKQDPLLNELRNRTFWSAFCLDRVISTGEGHCFTVNRFMDVELPLPESYFFGLSGVSNTGKTNVPLNGDVYGLSKINSQSSDIGIEQEVSASNTQLAAAFNIQLKSKVTIGSFNKFYKAYPQLLLQNERSAFIKCYSLWGSINEYMMDGGRVKRSAEVPWDLENSTVGKITKEVDDFWNVIPAEWKWGNFDYASQRPYHIKKLFMITSMNCLHFLTIIFCIREYLPFLPSKELGPCGPIEPPFMPQPPYTTYWSDMSRKCFAALRQLCEILKVVFETESENTKGSINLIESSPFFSFCAFVCAIQCNYGSNFPFMDPDAALYKKNKDKNLSYCYKMVLKILKSRESFCPVTKNWLHMVFKVQEMYKSVAGSRTSSKVVPNGSEQTQTYVPIQPTILNPNSSQNTFQRPADPPGISQSTAQRIQNQSLPNYGAPLPLGQLMSPSDSMASNRDQLPSGSSSLIPDSSSSIIVGTGSDGIFGSNIGNSENNGLLTNSKTTPVLQHATTTSDIASGSSSNPSSTPRFPIEVEPETDKLSLLFSDQEFEMLMQFSK
ncbi:Zn(II)2Cys6 transcription factor [Kluyveromyces lactis]|uniref:KLLA0F02299p n=1 Tax=Kluyveromyces lactis (strain ATCC 8585 / CBS 2359 / DSM 70799 / NBRC 1267 / NRRL Y-1140 / WM37) TaxID=284590 RepID=Q6CLK5_KLULA|nr:uncharacterized protein KLLA0_F02299g [Kluyveromyces lactis]CAG97891.1 KLLA0F02299p [Kluyveromyces lactis]|eukprot:XP_455184.1 uncharacterized protein KLLA0_F02299g [Kluyveromyces lactis]